MCSVGLSLVKPLFVEILLVITLRVIASAERIIGALNPLWRIFQRTRTLLKFKCTAWCPNWAGITVKGKKRRIIGVIETEPKLIPIRSRKMLKIGRRNGIKNKIPTRRKILIFLRKCIS